MSADFPLDLAIGGAIVTCPKCGAEIAVAEPGPGVLIHESDGFHVYDPAAPEWVTRCTHDPVCGLERECEQLQDVEAAHEAAERWGDAR